jgi:hypothetical protein
VQWWKVESSVGNVNCLAWSADGNHLYYGDGNSVGRIGNINLAYDFAHADVSGTDFILNTGSHGFSALVTGIAPDPNETDRLMVTLGQYGGTGKVQVTESATSAMTFTNVWNPGAGLTAMPVYDGVIHADNNDVMVVGTEYGVMATDDGGATWAFENNGMARVPTFTVRQQTMTWDDNPFGPDYVENQWVIYAGTHGRGFFRTETLLGLAPGPEGAAALTGLSVFPSPASSTATVGFSLPDRAEAVLTVYDMNGRAVQQLKQGMLAPGAHRVELDVRQLGAGTYLVALQAGTEQRIARFVVSH